MNEKLTGMVGEMNLAKLISGQFEYPQRNVRTLSSLNLKLCRLNSRIVISYLQLLTACLKEARIINMQTRTENAANCHTLRRDDLLRLAGIQADEIDLAK